MIKKPEIKASSPITGEMCIQRLKHHGVNMTAKELAASLGTGDSRAVATALRKPTKDGRVKWGKWINGVATSRFVRLSVKGGAK